VVISGAEFWEKDALKQNRQFFLFQGKEETMLYTESMDRG
jgi:hypothetical protein